jgi:hypothetical protein
MAGRKKGERIYSATGEQVWPYAASLIKPGEVRNPKGTSEGRRAQKAFRQFMEEYGLDKELALVCFAIAFGHTDLLEFVGMDGKKRKREPSLEWMKFLVDQMDGALPRALEVKSADAAAGIKSIRDFLNAPEPNDETKEG